jgi:hypothetical protein
LQTEIKIKSLTVEEESYEAIIACAPDNDPTGGWLLADAYGNRRGVVVCILLRWLELDSYSILYLGQLQCD